MLQFDDKSVIFVSHNRHGRVAMRAMIVLACLVIAAPAAAQSSSVEEVSLRHRLRLAPDDRTTMANLASLYARSGRPARAQRLYRGLL